MMKTNTMPTISPVIWLIWLGAPLIHHARVHGAMTPLVGCEEYGCPTPQDTEWRPSRVGMPDDAPAVVLPDQDESTADDKE